MKGNIMPKTTEYLERRILINEAVLHDLGRLVASHMPALNRQLGVMGEAWNAAIDNLDKNIPETPEIGAYYEIHVDQ